MGETTPAATFTYTCEDHPDVKQDKPGKCPQCDKYLVVVTPPGKRAVYACQNPDTECGIYSNRPGPCPKCGQPLGCSEIVDDTSANQPNGDDKQVPDSESPNDDSPQADE